MSHCEARFLKCFGRGTRMRRFRNLLRLMFLLLSVATLPACCFGIDITVRLVNAKTGRLVRATKIFLYTYAEYPKVLPDAPPPLQAVTSSDGRAVFAFAAQAPEHVIIVVPGPKYCSPFRFAGQDVMRNGVVPEEICYCGAKLRQKITPTPGEIVFFVASYTRAELVRRELTGRTWEPCKQAGQTP
jgi:hypothetical protein